MGTVLLSRPDHQHNAIQFRVNKMPITPQSLYGQQWRKGRGKRVLSSVFNFRKHFEDVARRNKHMGVNKLA